jgi:hypothetical protein
VLGGSLVVVAVDDGVSAPPDAGTGVVGSSVVAFAASADAPSLPQPRTTQLCIAEVSRGSRRRIVRKSILSIARVAGDGSSRSLVFGAVLDG